MSTFRGLSASFAAGSKISFVPPYRNGHRVHVHDPVVTINKKAPRTAIENIRGPIGATSAIYKKNQVPMIPFILGEAFLYCLECKLLDTMLNIVLKVSAIITYNDSAFVYCISMCISFWSFSIPVPVQPISPFLPGPENSLQNKGNSTQTSGLAVLWME